MSNVIAEDWEVLGSFETNEGRFLDTSFQGILFKNDCEQIEWDISLTILEKFILLQFSVNCRHN